VRADSARDFSHSQLISSVLESLDVTPHLRHEDGQLVPEGRRLRVDAVRAADHQRELVLHSHLSQGGFEQPQVLRQDVSRLLDLQR
jgi:hypothetical protein